MQTREKKKQELPIKEEMSPNPIVLSNRVKGSASTLEPESCLVEVEGCSFSCSSEV